MKLLAKVLRKLQKVSGFKNAKAIDYVLPHNIDTNLKK